MVSGSLNLEIISRINLEFARKHNLFVKLMSCLNEDLLKCGAQSRVAHGRPTKILRSQKLEAFRFENAIHCGRNSQARVFVQIYIS